MYKKRVYNIKLAIDRLKKYCALQDRCKADVIKKMKDWGLLEISRNHILEILIQEEYINETSVELFLNCSDKNEKKK